MRPFLIAIATFLTFSSAAQTGQHKVFKKTEYINGNIYRQTKDTIKSTNEQVDIYFFKRHFSLPYYLPGKFIDQQYKNQKISVWANPNGKKDYQQNWENTYTYDRVGRVINYAYSGCFKCSNFSYNYIVTYNPVGQVEQISSATNVRDSFKFYYNDKGDIVKLEKYLSDKLETVIELAN